MPVKHLLSLVDLGREGITHLIDRSVSFAVGQDAGHTPLRGKIVGVYFCKPSTRTRTSFTVGALTLGAQTIAYGPKDLQIVTGETIEDTARVLSGYLNALVIRTNGSIAEMKRWAYQDQMAIINAMSENEHPTQAIADLSTIKANFKHLENLHVLYLGEGNNTATALAFAIAHIPGMKITFVTPTGYGVQEPILQQVYELAHRHGAIIEHQHRMDKLPQNVDVVYTTRWQTMGEPHTSPTWREKFMPYSVTPVLMAEVAKPSGTIFMHDLPAVRGEEVHEDVLNGPHSLAWQQARHKLFSAMAILEWCLDSRV